jgi:hypothetical protein
MHAYGKTAELSWCFGCRRQGFIEFVHDPYGVLVAMA